MKSLFIVLIFALVANAINGQDKKITFTNVKTIAPEEISKEKVGDRTNIKLGDNALKNGVNKMELSSGVVLYIEYQKKKAKKVTIAKTDGTIIRELFPSDAPAQFRCGAEICSCEGEKDCFELGRSNLCSSLSCFNLHGYNFCICKRN